MEAAQGDYKSAADEIATLKQKFSKAKTAKEKSDTGRSLEGAHRAHAKANCKLQRARAQRCFRQRKVTVKKPTVLKRPPKSDESPPKKGSKGTEECMRKCKSKDKTA